MIVPRSKSWTTILKCCKPNRFHWRCPKLQKLQEVSLGLILFPIWQCALGLFHGKTVVADGTEKGRALCFFGVCFKKHLKRRATVVSKNKSRPKKRVVFLPALVLVSKTVLDDVPHWTSNEALISFWPCEFLFLNLLWNRPLDSDLSTVRRIKVGKISGKYSDAGNDSNSNGCTNLVGPLSLLLFFVLLWFGVCRWLTFDFETDLGSFSWVVQPTRIPEIGILHYRGGKWLVKTDSLFPQPDSCFPSLILASPAQFFVSTVWTRFFWVPETRCLVFRRWFYTPTYRVLKQFGYKS